MQHILGHTAIKQHLANSVLRGRISHAQLFIGPEGSAALPLAIAYASMVNCQNPQTTGAAAIAMLVIKVANLYIPIFIFRIQPLAQRQKVPTLLSHAKPLAKTSTLALLIGCKQ